MEEKERRGSLDSLETFANKFAESLVKSIVAESSNATTCSISCSVECHSKASGGGGSVSWTPDIYSREESEDRRRGNSSSVHAHSELKPACHCALGASHSEPCDLTCRSTDQFSLKCSCYPKSKTCLGNSFKQSSYIESLDNPSSPTLRHHELNSDRIENLQTRETAMREEGDPVDLQLQYSSSASSLTTSSHTDLAASSLTTFSHTNLAASSLTTLSHTNLAASSLTTSSHTNLAASGLTTSSHTNLAASSLTTSSHTNLAASSLTTSSHSNLAVMQQSSVGSGGPPADPLVLDSSPLVPPEDQNQQFSADDELWSQQDRDGTDLVHRRLTHNSRVNINSPPSPSASTSSGVLVHQATAFQAESGVESRTTSEDDLNPRNQSEEEIALRNTSEEDVQLRNNSGDTLGCQSNLEEILEFRNKSEENLATSAALHQPNGFKTSLRKGSSVNDIRVSVSRAPAKNTSRSGFLRSLGLKKPKDEVTERLAGEQEDRTGGRNKIKNFRKTLTNIFQLKPREGELCDRKNSLFKIPTKRNKSLPPGKRALPPVPAVRTESRTPSPHSDLGEGEWSARQPDFSETVSAPVTEVDPQMHFAASIVKVKDHGWYWGPLSGEAAERILAGEPDGSFVVRDSSDHHHIFSLTFKLNGFVRHVRIEHDQGNFSFGSTTKFKSTTIVDFIENAVEHSRSGRYLFFLHRRPVLGPMRVQLLHPVSRFKRVQSLQHLCRYVIVKHVRKDHLEDLPVPNRIKTYLNTPFYYSEQVEAEEEEASLQQDLEEENLAVANLGEAEEVVQSFPGTPEYRAHRMSPSLLSPQLTPTLPHPHLSPTQPILQQNHSPNFLQSAVFSNPVELAERAT